MAIAQTLEDFLYSHEVSYTLQRHRASTSSLATAHSAHIDESDLAKSVVLQDEGGYVLAVLPASRRLEIDRLREELGRSLHLSEERDMIRLFPDCVAGAVPPLGAAYGLPTVIDASLEERSEVYFEGGDHETLVRMAGPAFLDLLDDASVADIATESPGLSAALVMRERLYEAGLSVGRANSAPLASGTRWRRRLERVLARLGAALADHVDETEGTDGLLEEISDQAPRLARQVDQLRLEHTELVETCGKLQDALHGDVPAQTIRRRAHDLLKRLEEHRHRGADLVYEAFGVDIGGG